MHFYSVPFVTASSALKKHDKDYENVADSMRIPLWKSFTRVIVPLSLPAILEIFLYYFINSMVTVSAVVFLYSAPFKVASIAITHMEEAGDIAQAAAMSVLILLVNIVARGIYELLVYRIKKRNERRKTCLLYTSSGQDTSGVQIGFLSIDYDSRLPCVDAYPCRNLFIRFELRKYPVHSFRSIWFKTSLIIQHHHG